MKENITKRKKESTSQDYVASNKVKVVLKKKANDRIKSIDVS